MWWLGVPVAAAVALVACGEGSRERALPAVVVVDDVAVHLSAHVGETSGPPVRLERVQPAKARGQRMALLTPPGARVAYDVRVPAGGILQVGTALILDGRTPDDVAGVRYTVSVNDRIVHAHDEQPKPGRRHVHWHDAEVDLGAWEGRDVRLTLATARRGEGPLPGTPAWSRVQLLRRSTHPRQPASAHAPNVLLVVVDTLRVDHVGLYDEASTTTPNLDAWANGGMVFEEAFAQAPWTLPSMATLFTGLYPRGHGVVGRSEQWGAPAGAAAQGSWAYLSDELPTLAASARANGISTFGVTSNLLISRENNLARGFERFVELPVSPMPIQWARAEDVNATFDDWLRANREWRFLAYLHYMEPHDPYVPSEAARTAAPADMPREVRDGVIRNLARRVEQGEATVSDSWLSYLRSLYAKEVKAWDRAFADLLALLDAHGVSDQTLVVFTADHGEELMDHGQLGHRKQVFGESVQVPLVIAGPGVLSGRRSDLVQLIDVYPTVANVLDLPTRDDLPGRDLFGDGPSPDVIFSETRYGVGEGGRDIELVSLRSATDTLIWQPDADVAIHYRRDSDPGESRPIPHGPTTESLLARARAWRSSIQPPPTVPIGVQAPIDERLRALGYIE